MNSQKPINLVETQPSEAININTKDNQNSNDMSALRSTMLRYSKQGTSNTNRHHEPIIYSPTTNLNEPPNLRKLKQVDDLSTQSTKQQWRKGTTYYHKPRKLSSNITANLILNKNQIMDSTNYFDPIIKMNLLRKIPFSNSLQSLKPLMNVTTLTPNHNNLSRYQHTR